jgi:hypothetical protein
VAGFLVDPEQNWIFVPETCSRAARLAGSHEAMCGSLEES